MQGSEGSLALKGKQVEKAAACCLFLVTLQSAFQVRY